LHNSTRNVTTLGTFRPALFSEPRFKLAAVLVRLTQKSLTEQESKKLAQEAVSVLYPPAEPNAVDLLFQTTEAHIKRRRKAPSILNPDIFGLILPDEPDTAPAHHRFTERYPARRADGRTATAPHTTVTLEIKLL
jgi:hypothetical protein